MKKARNRKIGGPAFLLLTISVFMLADLASRVLAQGKAGCHSVRSVPYSQEQVLRSVSSRLATRCT